MRAIKMELQESDKEKLKVAKVIIGERIRRRLSQTALAHRLGVTQQQISKLENGDFDNLGTGTLQKVLSVLGHHVRVSAIPLHLIFKGGILKAWNKKIAVALHKGFFETLPQWPKVSREQADIAWLIYDLKPPAEPSNHYELFRERTVYTKRPKTPAETELRMGEPMEQFVRRLEAELDEVAV